MKNDLHQTALYQIKLENSLYEFTKEAWRWIDHAIYEDNWHVQVVCHHIQATFEKRLPKPRLIVSIPPSLAKSLITSVMFPAWVWTFAPEKQFLTGSNSSDLSTRDTLRTRDLITSDWYQYHWGYKFKLASDQNEKTYFKNDKFGHRYGFSTGARITGQRADIILLDDALNYEHQYSKARKNQVNRLISGGLSTRFNDEHTGLMIVIGQRLCVDDPIGYLLSKKAGWVYLRLPMEGDPKNKCKTPIFTDNRKKNESLWVPRWGKKEIADKKIQLGSRDFSSQYNQQPFDDENAILKMDNLGTYRELPNCIQIIDSWDTAFGEKKQNDYSVGITWGYTRNIHYVINVWRGKLKFPQLKQKMVEVHDRFKSNLVLVEAAATGVPAVDELKATTRIPFKLIKPIKDKVMRAQACAPAFESGKVSVPERAPWLMAWKEELESFPNGEHDDQVDATSMYLAYMNRPINYDNLFAII